MNVKLMDEVLTQIDLQPKTWGQNTWHCGTIHCIGGWAAILTGWTPIRPASAQVQKGRIIDGTFTVAQRALGLTHVQAWALFSGCNTRDSIDLVIDAILSGSL